MAYRFNKEDDGSIKKEEKKGRKKFYFSSSLSDSEIAMYTSTDIGGKRALIHNS
jgi:hypothetical protein